MIKKILCLILAAMLVFGFASCVDKSEDDSDESGGESSDGLNGDDGIDLPEIPW